MISLFQKLFRSVMPVILFLLLTSCSPKQTVVEEQYPDGSPRRVCIYRGKGDKRILLKETFLYQNGTIEITGGYRDGERDGYWISFYENGNKWSEGFFRNGKNEGERLTYFENGRLRYEAWYKNDERTGTWKFYDQAGNLIKTVDYSEKHQSP